MLYVLWIGLFFFLLSWFLVQGIRLDALNRSVWKAFVVLLPFSLYLSPVTTAISALLIAILQLSVRFFHYLPSCLQWYCRFLRAVLIDIIAIAAFLIFFRKRCLKQVPSCYPGKGEIPILLIHGYRHDRGAWMFHGPRLAQKGFGPIYTLDLGSSFSTIENYSSLVDSKVREIFKETGKEKLILVGFSMGGLVASDYVLHRAVPQTIKALITVGSPLEGTILANLGPEDCARQMRYRNPFVLNLRNRISETAIPFTQLGSTTDTTVIPQTSAFATSNTIHLEGLGHLEMLYSERITSELSRLLMDNTGLGHGLGSQLSI